MNAGIPKVSDSDEYIFLRVENGFLITERIKGRDHVPRQWIARNKEEVFEVMRSVVAEQKKLSA